MFKLIFFCLVILLSDQAISQNMVVNGTFDTDTSHWSNPSVTEVWVSDDGAPMSGNGSVRFGTISNNGGSVWLASDFISVTDGYMYMVATSYKKPSASVSPYLSITVRWYDENDNYLGEYPAFGSVQMPVTTNDTWLDSELFFENIVSGSSKAKVYLWVGTTDNGTSESYALFDDVILFQDTVFLSSFD